MLAGLNIFKALGEESKHRILKTLLSGEACACEIPKKIGRTQSNTSMHLTKLAGWGLIMSRKDGKKILYSINDNRIEKLLAAAGKVRR